jgi:hypothetical protein
MENIGVLANNRSLCVCPINKNGTCHNASQCISGDENGISDKKFLCMCRKGFREDRCEIADTELILSYNLYSFISFK